MRSCDWTDRIESATLRGALDADERSHLRECPECRKLTEIVELLMAHGRAAERRGARHVPSARAVLLRARQIRARKIERRALRPIVWMERIAVVVVLVAGLAIASWLARRLGDARPPLLRLGPLGPELSGPPDPIAVALLVCGAALLATTLFGLAGLGGSLSHRTRR